MPFPVLNYYDFAMGSQSYLCSVTVVYSVKSTPTETHAEATLRTQGRYHALLLALLL